MDTVLYWYPLELTRNEGRTEAASIMVTYRAALATLQLCELDKFTVALVLCESCCGSHNTHMGSAFLIEGKFPGEGQAKWDDWRML